ncbi:MAG: amidoligase family protein [Bacilli bacterium]|nr:amidoligase family protein [Bacilli bacterium]
MGTNEESSLLNYLANIPFVYRDKLNVPEDMKFGAEIEFMSDDVHDIYKVLRKALNNQTGKRKYYKLESNNRVVRYNQGKRIFEIKTPVLYNSEENFDSLKQVCDAFRNHILMPSNQKGVHVHVDLSTLERNERFLNTFLKIFCIYEHIIFRFSYGEEEYSNINIASYSREVSNRLYNYLIKHNYNEEFEIFLNDLRELLKCKSYAINFHKKDIACNNETIEVRTFNSTMNPVIIQNDINLVLNIINQIVNNEIDLDLLDFRFREYDRKFYVKDSYSKINLQDAVEFSDLVFKDSEDKDYFLRQYAIKTNPKKKKLVI